MYALSSEHWKQLAGRPTGGPRCLVVRERSTCGKNCKQGGECDSVRTRFISTPQDPDAGLKWQVVVSATDGLNRAVLGSIPELVGLAEPSRRLTFHLELKRATHPVLRVEFVVNHVSFAIVLVQGPKEHILIDRPILSFRNMASTSFKSEPLKGEYR